MMPREDIVSVYEQGVDAVVDLVQTLSAQLDEQREMIAALTTRVKELEDRLAKNSRNSSKPPASDPPHKPNPKSLRGKSGKPPGGQKGHPGRTLSLVERSPDRVVLHDPRRCHGCGMDLEEVEPSDGYERRRFIDVPPSLALSLTEHRARTKKCSGCGRLNAALFPEEPGGGVVGGRGVGYGPRIKALCAYLMGYQLLPYDRTRELLSDLFGSPAPGVGTLHSALEASYEGLEGVEERIKEGLRRSEGVVHFDETGFRASQKRMWVHVASTPDLTHLGVHRTRGNEATDEIGILPSFGGVAMHDGWAAYRNYEGCSHALCNAHHLRELTFLEEEHSQRWAGRMKKLLVWIEGSVRRAREKGRANSLDPEEVEKYERIYRRLIKAGMKANPPQTKRRGKRGPPKQTKGKNLVERLERDREWVLRFMHDFRVPFDNNQAERDVRMVKVKQKISGGCRTERGARQFCRLRSYISTARKQGQSVLGALEGVFVGEPFIPAIPA